jgi:hypothetical protein
LEELQLDLDIIKAEMGDDGSAEGWIFFPFFNRTKLLILNALSVLIVNSRL